MDDIRETQSFNLNKVKILNDLESLKVDIMNQQQSLEKMVCDKIAELEKILKDCTNEFDKCLNIISNIKLAVLRSFKEDSFIINLVRGYDDMASKNLKNTFKFQMNIKVISKNSKIVFTLEQFFAKTVIETDLNLTHSKSKEIIAEIAKFKYIYSQAPKTEALNNIIKQIDDVNGRESISTILIQSNSCQDRQHAACLQTLPKIFHKVKFIDFIGLDEVRLSWLLPKAAEYSKMRRLKFTNCNPDNQLCFQQIALSIKDNLKSLEIVNCKMLTEGLSYLENNISKIASLKKLDLSFNLIGSNGVFIIKKLLPSMTCLKSLELSKIDMETQSATIFAEGLHNLPLLEVLNVSENSIKIKGVTLIIAACSKLANIKSIDTSINEVTADDDDEIEECFAIYLKKMEILENFFIDMTSTNRIKDIVENSVSKDCRLYLSNERQKSLMKRKPRK